MRPWLPLLPPLGLTKLFPQLSAQLCRNMRCVSTYCTPEKKTSRGPSPCPRPLEALSRRWPRRRRQSPLGRQRAADRPNRRRRVLPTRGWPRERRGRVHDEEEVPLAAPDQWRTTPPQHHQMLRITPHAASHIRRATYAPHANARHARHRHSRPAHSKSMHSPVYGFTFDVTDCGQSTREHRARIDALPLRHRARRFATRAENTPSLAAPCSPLSRTASFPCSPDPLVGIF